MGGVNSMCIPRTDPNFCRENHLTGKSARRNGSMFSHAFNLDDSTVEPPTELLNINNATEEELMTLPGVNRTVARQIVQYRLQINGFKKIEDIALCSGVGACKLNVIRSEITVGKRPASAPDSPSYYQREPSSVESKPRLPRSTSASRLRVSLNDSNVFQLMRVPGISQSLAENIVAHRDKKGRFLSLDELVKVKGINLIQLRNIRLGLLLNSQDIQSSDLTNGDIRTPDGKSKASSTDSVSLRSDRTLSGSQCDLLKQFSPLNEKHVRPIVTPFSFLRDNSPAIRIATWNLQQFCLDKGSNPGVLEVLCMTILENGLSIIAFQELAHRNALHKVVAELNYPSLPSCKRWAGHRGTWKVAVSDRPVGRMLQAMEYNAFIYDASCVISLESLEILGKSEGKAFARQPLLAYFKVDQIDFVFVCAHLKPAGPNTDHCSELEQEVHTVSALIEALQEQLPGERDIIVAGDFNMAPTEKDFVVLDNAGYFNAIPNTRPTNISKQFMDGSCCYDNIWFSKSVQQLYTGMSGVIRCGLSHPFIPDGWNWGGLISDHCPVWAELVTDRDQERDV